MKSRKHNYITVRYVDAFYITRNSFKKKEDIKLYQNIAIGRLFVQNEDFIGISFSDIDKKPDRGLILPRESLVSIGHALNNEKSPVSSHSKVAGIFWRDIVYFENAQIPSGPTDMYTEGKIVYNDKNIVVVKNPETLKFKKEGTKNHPRKKPNFYVIPKVLIKNFIIYE